MTSEDHLYVNHAGTSWPKPNSVLQAIDLAQRATPPEWPVLIEQSVNTVARFFSVNADHLLITPGCTSALNLAIREFAWQSGDQVLTTHFEHHALHRNLVALQLRGVEFITARHGPREMVDLDHVEHLLKSSNIQLVAMTAACNVTGLMLPVKEIVEIAHRHGAKVLIDGAQVAGWYDFNLSELGVDLFTFAGHKGLQAPFGVGGMYIAPNVEMGCPTTSCNLPHGTDQRFVPSYCDAGSMNVAALAGLAAGCRWLSEPTQGKRLAKTRMLADAFCQQLKQDPRVTVYHDANFDVRMPTVAFTIEGVSTQSIQRKLSENRITASSGFQCAPRAHEALGTAIEGTTRISFGSFHDSDCIQRICQAIL